MRLSCHPRPAAAGRLLLLTMGMLLVAQGASPLTFHTGYSRATWISDRAPKLAYGDRVKSRPGLLVGFSHVLPDRWAALRLGVASVARGTRSLPGTIYRAFGNSNRVAIDISAIELSALGEIDLPVAYVLLAGPYLDLQTSCSGWHCPDRRINGGIKYGIGVRMTYQKNTYSLDFIREQGLWAMHSPMRRRFDAHHKGFLIQVGIGRDRFGGEVIR